MKNYGIITAVALGQEGAEFNYIAETAHATSKARAQEIADTLNAHNYKRRPGTIWHVYTVDRYSRAYDAATQQKITYYKGQLKIYSGWWMARY